MYTKIKFPLIHTWKDNLQYSMHLPSDSRVQSGQTHTQATRLNSTTCYTLDNNFISPLPAFRCNVISFDFAIRCHQKCILYDCKIMDDNWGPFYSNFLTLIPPIKLIHVSKEGPWCHILRWIVSVNAAPDVITSIGTGNCQRGHVV